MVNQKHAVKKEILREVIVQCTGAWQLIPFIAIVEMISYIVVVRMIPYIAIVLCVALWH